MNKRVFEASFSTFKRTLIKCFKEYIKMLNRPVLVYQKKIMD